MENLVPFSGIDKRKAPDYNSGERKVMKMEKKFAQAILTERLCLRPFRREDAADYFAFAKLKDLGRNAGWKPHESIRESRYVVNQYHKEGNVLAITLKGEDRAVGTVGLHADDRRPGFGSLMLGYTLSPDYRHRGIATEATRALVKDAFERLLMPMITAYCYPENTASAKVLERNGFVYEGKLRRSFLLYDGSEQDLLCYSLTREEYAGLDLLNIDKYQCKNGEEK